MLCLEAREPPPAAVAAFMAERAGVEPADLTILFAPTASLAGSVQIAARVVETALHKLHELKFDVNRVVSGFGSCPLPPVARKDPDAIGRTNDAVLYGGQVELLVEGEDDELAELVAAAVRRRPPKTTASRSASCSRTRTGTSTRSIRCSSARPRSAW